MPDNYGTNIATHIQNI